MYKDLQFPILIVHRDIKADSVAGERVREIAEELSRDGFRILLAANVAEGRLVASTHHGLACILVAAEGVGEDQRLLHGVVELIRVARVRAPRLPIFALGEQVTLENAPAEAMADLNQLRGILYLFEDTVPFLARQVARAARGYLEDLLPPFFRALVEHTAQSHYSWHTPGHGGGVAYRKSPVGQAFHQFFGENTLRSDLSVSVPQLGSLLDHTGPLAEAEARAARNFGADHTFFVINGTSTANKIVWHGIVGRDDLVLVDRNCHKSILHAIIMTGAIPLYLTPSRNELGIIGPIPLSEFSPQAIQAKIAASPLARKRARPGQRIRLAVVTNSTYDGLCYNAERLKQTLSESVEVLHFDEAWFAYAAFHEFYAGRFGMGTSRSDDGPLVFSTHSTHKLLAAFSQASMIHARDGGRRRLDRQRFNEAFMMHTSTSPQYGIMASLDVASAMMEGPAGRSLIQETFDEALSFRRALTNVRHSLAADDWWFEVWQPENVEGLESADWSLQPSADWHGFGDVADDYVLLDPIKVTLVTPGLTAAGLLQDRGIPAAVLSRFLWERGLVVEKTGLYSLLVLFSMGITKGKWSTLVTELLEFKRLYDANTPLNETLPSIARRHRRHYDGLGLRDLCDRLHACYRENATARAMRRMYTQLPEPACTPAEAYDRLVRAEVEAVPLDALEGRVSAVMLVPYPPGIPLIMPGERFTRETLSIIDYLRFARRFEAAFPGFEADVHGLENRPDASYVTCLVE